MGNHYDPRDEDDHSTQRQVFTYRMKVILQALERQSLVYIDVDKMTDEQIEVELFNLEQALMNRCRAEALKELIEKQARDSFRSRAGYYAHEMRTKPAK